MRTCKTVFCGSSITAGNHVSAGEGYVDLVGVALPAVTIVNLGTPGAWIDTASQGAAADAAFDGSKQVNICVVEFGVNDLIASGGNESAAAFEAILKAFCQARTAAGFNAILVLPTMAINGNATFNGRRDAANVLTAADPSFYTRLLDLGVMAVEATTANPVYFSDGVHPTAFGNTVIAPPITQGILALIDLPGTVAWRSL